MFLFHFFTFSDFCEPVNIFLKFYSIVNDFYSIRFKKSYFPGKAGSTGFSAVSSEAPVASHDLVAGVFLREFRVQPSNTLTNS